MTNSNADKPTHKVSDGWYYASEGEKHGPIEPAELIGLSASGVIGRETLVWRHGMRDWMRLDKTELLASNSEGDSPPPLPHSNVSDNQKKAKEGWFWYIVAPLALGPLYLIFAIYLYIKEANDEDTRLKLKVGMFISVVSLIGFYNLMTKR